MSDPQKQVIINRLLEAREETKRFFSKCNQALESVDDGSAFYYRNQDFAAAKRASMDLSRSLAKLRRSPYEE